jgi:hypothetical protein
MSFSRRKFLRSASVLSVAAFFPIRNLFAKTGRNEPNSSRLGLDAAAGLNQAAFARCVNTDFVFSQPYKRSVKVKLIKVNDLTPPNARHGRECFAAIFAGPTNTPLPQETYSVAHGSLGNFDMLVVPVGRDRQRTYYEAVFNRLHG